MYTKADHFWYLPSAHIIEPRNAINLDELCWQKLITNGAKKSDIHDDKAPVNTNRWDWRKEQWLIDEKLIDNKINKN